MRAKLYHLKSFIIGYVMTDMGFGNESGKMRNENFIHPDSFPQLGQAEGRKMYICLMFENKNQPLAPKQVFYGRLMRMWLIATGLTMLCLLIGIVGYHYIGHLIWIDALHNASMILSGMGPVANIDNVAGKLFSSAYALFSGVAFITNIGIFLSPVVHRFLHKIHVNTKDK